MSEVVWGGFGIKLAQNHAVKLVEDRLDFTARLALHAARHHARGSLGDGAAFALKADVLDDAFLDIKVDKEVVAAGGVVAFGGAVRRCQLAEIPRLLLVFANLFVVKL